MVSIGEEIISFDRPRFIFLVDCIEIARWSGVEHLHSVTLLHTCWGGGGGGGGDSGDYTCTHEHKSNGIDTVELLSSGT